MFWLLENSLWALVLLSVVLLTSRFLRLGPTARHLLYGLLLLRLVAPPASAWVEAWQPSPARGVFSLEHEYFGVHPEADGFRLARWLAAELGIGGLQSLAYPMFWIWLLGACWIVARELHVARRAAATLRSGRKARPATLQLVRQLAEELGVEAPPVRVLTMAPAPFVYAMGKPVLVLDRASDRSPCRLLLTHELTHLRRRDHLWVWVCLLARVLHWWNPLFWIIHRRMAQVAELACDAGVVRREPSCRMAFARALLAAAERASSPLRPPMGVEPARDERPLERGRGQLRVGASARQERNGAVARSDQQQGKRLDQRARRWRRLAAGLYQGQSSLSLRLRAILELRAPARGTAVALALAGCGWIATSMSAAFSLEVEPGGHGRAFLQEQLGHSSYAAMLRAANRGIQANPEQGIHWHERALALFRIGDLEGSRAALERQLALGYRQPTALYNLACVSAHRGDIPLALQQLERAIEIGWRNPPALASDPDLALLRDHPRFKQLRLQLEPRR